MTFFRHWALVVLLAAAIAPVAATAQSTGTSANSFYASVSGLYVVPTDSDLTTKSGGSTFSTDLEMDAGFGLLLAVGYGADVGLRGEVELGYRQADFDKFDGLTIQGNGVNVSVERELSVEGDVNTLSLMVNGFYTFETGKFRPYLGVGLGLARHDVTLVGWFSESDRFTDDSEKVSEDDVVFAYQGMAGVSYPMSENTEVRLGYRYFGTGDADFDGLEASYGTHNIEAGILFRF